MKLNLDFRSIKFRLWLHFLLFTALIMLFIWFLQVFFLNNYYKDMKIRQTKEVAMSMKNYYQSLQLKPARKAAMDEAKANSTSDDLYIRIVSDGKEVYPNNDTTAYDKDIEHLSGRLKKTKDTFVDAKHEDKATGLSTYFYATVLNKSKTDIIYIAAPLYPVTSTVKILQRQLFYIIIISVIMSVILSIYLSSRISKPITRTTEITKRLSAGEYGISFTTNSEYAEISDLLDNLNKMSSELERSDMIRKNIMANVSHDLRTPLTMIKSYAEMIKDLSGDNPVKRNEHLEVIIEEADRLNTLVNDMLALTAIQSGKTTMEMGVFNLYDSVQSILTPYKVLEVQQGFNVNFNCNREMYVEGDEKKIKQVISNLLSNAIKYCGQDKTVFINIRKWGKRVHCEVIDHGAGIKPEELKHIWDRYYKTSSEHVRPTTGSGLGLSIVREILVQHNAKYGAESKIGKGTTVWFELKSATPPS